MKAEPTDGQESLLERGERLSVVQLDLGTRGGYQESTSYTDRLENSLSLSTTGDLVDLSVVGFCSVETDRVSSTKYVN